MQLRAPEPGEHATTSQLLYDQINRVGRHPGLKSIHVYSGQQGTCRQEDILTKDADATMGNLIKSLSGAVNRSIEQKRLRILDNLFCSTCI